MASICCKAITRIGYYNPQERPDIHGIVNGDIAFGVMVHIALNVISSVTSLMIMVRNTSPTELKNKHIVRKSHKFSNQVVTINDKCY